MTEVLFLAHRIPYPPDKGDKIRSWRLFERLVRRHSVHLGCFVDDPDDLRHTDYLAGMAATAAFVPLRSGAARLKSAAALLDGRPLSFAYYDDARMRRYVRGVRRRPLAAEFAFSSTMAPYVARPMGRPRIVDFCDSDAEKWREFAATTQGPMRLVYRREGRALARAETQIANWAECAFAASADEARLFNERPGLKRRVEWFGNGVDTDYFSPDRKYPPPAAPAEVVFTGAMDYRANIDGIAWFANDVWPRVRADLPSVRFAIVGARPVAEIRALDGRDGVVVLGRVEDVRPHLADAQVVVAPLKVARGVQNKVLEAMAMARPVVATRGANAGIDARAGAEILVADRPDDFALELRRLLADPDLAAAIGRAARARMRADFNWEAQLSRFDAALSAFGIG